MAARSRTALLLAVAPALTLLAIASMGAGDGMVSQPNQPRASAAIPLPLPTEARLAQPESSDTRSPTSLAEFGSPLIPGQPIEPIDLGGVMRLAGARDLDIAITRQQLFRAVAELQQARVLWLPSIFLGPTWYRLDGQVQAIDGKVMPVSRSSLFVGGLASSANLYPAAPPGSGFPPMTGLFSILRFSDAIFLPMAARRVVASGEADLRASTNDAVLAASEAYFDLLRASGLLAIEREAVANAGALAEITGSFTRSGAGLEADNRRILTELYRRRNTVEDAVGQLEVASANLVQLLVLNPNQVLAPVEPAEMVIRLIPDEVCLDDMIIQALHHRPELASAQELVQATLLRLKQARLRPLVPSLAFSYAGGGFGGGPNGFFGNFNSRGDATISLFWELQNLGFADRAIARRSQAEHQGAALRLLKVENQVAAEVVAAHKSRLAAARRMKQASPAVKEGLESLRLNLVNIRRGAGLPAATRPIEVLQPIQALAQARADYLDAVLAYNRAEFRLYRAVGHPPTLPAPSGTPMPRQGTIPAPNGND